MSCIRDRAGSTVAVTDDMRPLRFVLALCLAGGLTTSTALAAPVTITFDAGDPIGGLAAEAILFDQYEAAVWVKFEPNAF